MDITSKFAQLEFRSPNGDPERGRTVFEGLLGTFPKRFDLWNVLVDLEISLIRQGRGDREQVRRLFRRITAWGAANSKDGSGGKVRLKSKKAKFFFKKWLEFEETFGEEGGKSVEGVKARAADYVMKLEEERSEMEKNGDEM